MAATATESLKRMIARRYAGRDLPVTLVLPDGGRLPLSPRAEIDIMRADNGIDMSLGVGRTTLDAALRAKLASLAAKLGLLLYETRRRYVAS